ncbi:MAG TPA: hypothetical protein VGG62_14885 [Terracidiphilus sp.]|jgi:hypothetical protein
MLERQLAKFNARVTKTALIRLAAECNKRCLETAQYTAYGVVLNELIMGHLPEAPEEKDPIILRRLVSVSNKKRGRRHLAKAG